MKILGGKNLQQKQIMILHGKQLLWYHQTSLDLWVMHIPCPWFDCMSQGIFLSIAYQEKNVRKLKWKNNTAPVMRWDIIHTSNKGSMARNEPASWNASLNLGPANNCK